MVQATLSAPGAARNDRHMTPHRLAAVAAVLLSVAALACVASAVGDEFPRGLLALVAVALALAAGFQALVHRGIVRVAGLAAAGALTRAAGALPVAAVALLVTVAPGGILVAVAAAALGLAAAKAAFRIRVALAPAPRPRRPVLLYNPRSGGGKAEKFHLADEAGARGYDVVALEPGTDLETLAREAVAAGADALAVAGGD